MYCIKKYVLCIGNIICSKRFCDVNICICVKRVVYFKFEQNELCGDYIGYVFFDFNQEGGICFYLVIIGIDGNLFVKKSIFI